MRPRLTIFLCLVLLAGLIGSSACADTRDRDVLTNADPSRKVECPPGQAAKGNCDEPPPPPPDEPVEPEFPAVDFGSLHAPMRFAVTPAGRLLIVDPSAGMVFRVDPALRLPDQGFRTRGKPVSVELIGGAVYVGNVDDGTIDVHEAVGGGFRESFGESVVDRPGDMAADTAALLLFVLDAEARDVKVFDAGGRFLRTISSGGTGAGQLTAPTALGLDESRGEILVSDYGPPDGAASVKIFAYDGSYVGRIDGAGTCNFMGCRGGFSRPQGTLANASRVFVTDGLLATIEVYDRTTLARLATIGGRTVYPTLRFPTDVWVGPTGDVLAASYRTGSIEVFEGAAP